MPEKKTDVEQLGGILSQFDQTTILSAVNRIVPRRDLGVTGPGPLVIPPVILYPGGEVPPEGGTGDKSTDCGPKEVEATDKGDWNANKAAARNSARAEARASAEDACGGKCPRPKNCNYLEQKNSLTGPEERPDPNNPEVIQFRYQSTSVGTCQCE